MAAKKPAPATVSVRVLVDIHVDGVHYRCGTVHPFPAEVAAALVKDGAADDHPEAVKEA